MSCSLSIFSCVQDVNRVISLLSDTTSRKDKPSPTEREGLIEPADSKDGWEVDSADWDWRDDHDDDTCESQNFTTNLWLQDCCISLSPSNDTLAIARDDKAVFLGARWDREAGSEPKTKYEVIWTGRLALEEGECVTDVLCIPLASQHRSSQGSPDWTCIVAGFTSGYMRIYLQNGSLLLSQLLHEDPVLRFKCRTWQPPKNNSNAEQVEEMAILYPGALVIIDGFSLYQSLRACRNQLAKAHASGSQEVVLPPPLAYKKWEFEGQKNITDIASCGVVTSSLFDQLQTASFIGGFNATIRGAAPAMSNFITTGSDPFVAVYSAVEGSSPPLISDVALEVASKLTTAVLSKLSTASGWLGWGSKPTGQPEEPAKPHKPKVEKGANLPARYGLPDMRRFGTTISLAPNGKLAVTTDEFGRVMLLDVRGGIAVRMWKGYRDAECGWITVEEESDHDENQSRDRSSKIPPRTALFLVIYAPKRGILEVWRTEQGPRVAAFNIGKDCRLLYAGHGIMGLGHVIRQGQAPPQHTLNCTLMHGDGTLKSFSVPFHCALSDKHSKRVRDLHLLKKLTGILEEAKTENGTDSRATQILEKATMDILVDIQTPQILQQAIQCLLSTVGLPSALLLRAVRSAIDKAVEPKRVVDDHDQEHEEEKPEDTGTLLNFCTVYSQLLQTHLALEELITGQHQSSQEQGETSREEQEEQSLSERFGITKSEAAQLLSSLKRCWKCEAKTEPNGSKVKSGASVISRMTVTSFLGCFEPCAAGCRESSAATEEQAGPSSPRVTQAVNLRKGLSADMALQLARFLFEGALLGRNSVDRLALPLDSSGIRPSYLMDLLLALWLTGIENVDSEPLRTLFKLNSLVSAISSLSGGVMQEGLDDRMNDDSISPWWDRIRHSLAQSTSVSKAFLMAAVCRSVAMAIITANKKVQSMEEEERSKQLTEGEWVSVSVEMERWNLLIYQLDDLVALRCFISDLPRQLRDDSGKLETGKVSRDSAPELSVVDVLGGGQGAVARILAHYLVLYNAPPDTLGLPRKNRGDIPQGKDGNEDHDDDDRPEVDYEPEIPDKQLEGLRELRERFPHSLHVDILWAECVLACASQWAREPEQTNKLFNAVGHLNCIHCTGLRHGLAILIWKRYLKEKVSATLVLMEKVGKAPKDRLCRKAVGLSYTALEQVLKGSQTVLELVLETSVEEAELLVLQTENFWHTGESGVGQRSITEEALEQAGSNVPIVQLHLKILAVLWVIVGLEMKSIRPLTLFDTKSKGWLFKELHASVSLPPETAQDDAVIGARTKLLTRVLSSVVSAMSTCGGHPLLVREHSDSTPAVVTPEQSFPVALTPKHSPEWPMAVFSLASQFGLDPDPLRRHYVCELFSSGLDGTAKEALLEVRDKQALGSSLLLTVGQRLAHVILHSSDSSESVNRLSRLPTNVSSWIKSQDLSKLVYKSSPLSHTVDLLSTVLTLLPTDTQEYSTAASLGEAVKFIL